VEKWKKREKREKSKSDMTNYSFFKYMYCNFVLPFSDNMACPSKQRQKVIFPLFSGVVIKAK
jgi:hypothetical protein